MPGWVIYAWDWIAQNAWGEKSAWLWSMVQGLALLGTMIAIACQILIQNRQLKSQNSQLKAQLLANGLQILTTLDGRWNSPQMIKARSDLCRNWEDSEKSSKTEQILVLSFFEDVGLYLKREVLDRDAIWDKWSHYIEGYWSMCSAEIMVCREDGRCDPTWYEKFQFLAGEMRRTAVERFLPKMSEQAVNDFILQEQELTPLGNTSSWNHFGVD